MTTPVEGPLRSLSSAATRPALGFLLGGCAIGLGAALWALPAPPPALRDEVSTRIGESGVAHPVTAVLLNFRSYDTLLEIGVLVAGLASALSVVRVSARRRPPGLGPIARALARVLVPIQIVVAGYLLWLGSHAPGGAFQGGAVLAATLVLITLSGLPLPRWLRGRALRALPAAGLLVFALVGVASAVWGGALLEYPSRYAGALILAIESALTVSIAVALAALYLLATGRTAGGGPNPGSER